MNRHVLLAAAFALLIGGAFGVSCTTPQPALECSYLPLYWAQYKLVSGTGTCSTYEGDRVDFQRYQPPDSTTSTFAFMPRRVGRITRFDPCTGAADGLLFRNDPADPNHLKEAPRGTQDVYPNAQGFCTSATLIPAEQNLEEMTVDKCLAAGINPSRLADGGTTLADGGSALKTPLPKPALHYKDTWSNYRQLSTARFTSNIWEADLEVVRDACTATYKVLGFFPPVGCATVNGDEDCNPDSNVAKGRAVGSGIPADFASKCVALTGAYEKGYLANFPGGINGQSTVNFEAVDGVCVPTKTIDELAALK